MTSIVNNCVGILAKCGAALGTRIMFPFAWPFLKVASLGALPQIGPSMPSPIRAVAASMGCPIAIIVILEAYLKLKHPLAVRRIRLWRRMLPIYLAYTMKEKEIKKRREKNNLSQEEVDALWDEHHEWGGDRVYDMVLEANGYIVKVAQIIASKPDVVPTQWITRLSKLFDSMPPLPWSEMKAVLNREIHSLISSDAWAGKEVNNARLMFDEIDIDPIATASIAQVHCARLSEQAAMFLGPGWRARDRVVVKIQRNVVKGLMAADLRNTERMGMFLKNVLPFEIQPIVQEMHRAVPLEFDFVREARLSQAIRSRLAVEEFSNLRIPRAAVELCTPKMLVSEFMEGVPFSVLLHEAKTDPELRKKMQDAMVTIVKAYGHMMIHDGLFHGDPHPGNILLGPNGKVILLDFGQCKALPFQMQIALAKLILAMSNSNPFPIISAMSELGVNFKSLKPSARVNPSDVVKMAFLIYDVKHMPEALVNPFGGAEEHLLSSIGIVDFPPDLWLISRVMMILRGICHDVGIDLHTTKLWRPYAKEVLKDRRAAQLRSRENHLLDTGILSAVKNGEGPSTPPPKAPAQRSSAQKTPSAARVDMAGRIQEFWTRR